MPFIYRMSPADDGFSAIAWLQDFFYSLLLISTTPKTYCKFRCRKMMCMRTGEATDRISAARATIQDDLKVPNHSPCNAPSPTGLVLITCQLLRNQKWIPSFFTSSSYIEFHPIPNTYCSTSGENDLQAKSQGKQLIKEARRGKSRLTPGFLRNLERCIFSPL